MTEDVGPCLSFFSYSLSYFLWTIESRCFPSLFFVNAIHKSYDLNWNRTLTLSKENREVETERKEMRD